MRRLLLLSFLLFTPAGDERANAILGPVDEGRELIGRQAPSLADVAWLAGTKPLVPGRTGKLMLVRWWTDRCVLCEHSAPALRALAEKHARVLDVVAIYHPKPRDRSIGERQIEAAARALGLHDASETSAMALASDAKWTALDRWWGKDASGRSRTFTSVTFLIDRDGKIAAIHTGGEFHDLDQIGASRCTRTPRDCARDYHALDAMIRALARP